MVQYWKQALETETPLQILGVPNAYTALMAKKAGFQAVYISGAAVANFLHGIPDIGLTTLEQVSSEVKRVRSVVDLSILVDCDTGWDNPEYTAKIMQESGASAIHIEDQVDKKKCGHLEGKQLVSKEEMVVRLESALKSDLFIIARTDAFTVEGFEKTQERCLAYQEAGAHAIFAEAFSSLEDYSKLSRSLKIPVLANITEFGKTPLFTTEELAKAGVSMILYPLSIARAMNSAAFGVMCDIRSHGTQKNSIDIMQNREELYEFLNYQEDTP